MHLRHDEQGVAEAILLDKASLFRSRSLMLLHGLQQDPLQAAGLRKRSILRGNNVAKRDVQAYFRFHTILSPSPF